MLRLSFYLSLCLFLTSCSSPEREPLALPETAPAAQAPASATLLFTGDIMVHGQQLEAAYQTGGEYDFHASFQAVKPVFREADLVVGNLELTLPGAPPYSGYPNFRSPDALAEALREAGFGLLVTANNHAMDSGRKGLQRTASRLREYGFYQTGTFISRKDRRRNHPLLIYLNGLEIALLNYCYPAPALTYADDAVSTLNREQLRKDLRRAHHEKPDAIIVLLHWGEEYQHQPTEEQRQLAQQLLRWGVDAVIGTHPHVVQPVERYTYRMRSGERREKLIAWSLGNFISNQNREGTDTGLMLRLRLEKDERLGKARITKWEYIPLWRCRRLKNGKRSFLAVPATSEGVAAAQLDSLEKKHLQKAAQSLHNFLDSTSVLR